MNYVFGVSTVAISIILFSLALPPFLLEESSPETIEITKIVFNLFCSMYPSFSRFILLLLLYFSSFGFTVAVMIRLMKEEKRSIFGIDTNRMWGHSITTLYHLLETSRQFAYQIGTNVYIRRSTHGSPSTTYATSWANSSRAMTDLEGGWAQPRNN